MPPEIAGEITATFVGIDEAKAAGFFSDIRQEVGCEDLYVVYGTWSQTVHPSLATSNTYVDPASPQASGSPRRRSRRGGRGSRASRTARILGTIRNLCW